MSNKKSLKSAPGVSRLIQRSSLIEDEKQELFYALETALASRMEHPWIVRKEGASFNPLPARLLEILLRECSVTDKKTLLEVLHHSTKETIFVLKSSSPTIATLAFGLDVLRHIQRNCTLLEKEKEELLKALRAMEDQTDSRLSLLFHTALERIPLNE